MGGWVDLFVYKYIIIFFISIFTCYHNRKLEAVDAITTFHTPLNKSEAIKHKEDLYKKYKSAVLVNKFKEMEDYQIKIDDREMKFDLKFFGEKPKNGWNLYFSLHGGGEVTDSVNERQWNRHKTLYKLKNGILLIPRSPTNTWDMWHQDHIDIFFNKLIQNMIIFHDVDPNRIYLMGYSAGGDGVYQLAPRMADRFAAAAMMAGHPNETSPLGLRNIGFTIHMGENDSSYNRNKVAIEWKNQLRTLRKNDLNGYSHLVKIHEGKGHWMGGLDSSAISWITKFTRDPFPKKVVWKQDDVTHKRFYWLKVDKPLKNSLIIASINNQTITIEETTISDIIIRLNDYLIDMDKRIIVQYSGEEVFNGIVHRNSITISKSIKEYGDPKSVYFGEIPISLKLIN